MRGHTRTARVREIRAVAKHPEWLQSVRAGTLVLFLVLSPALGAVSVAGAGPTAGGGQITGGEPPSAASGAASGGPCTGTVTDPANGTTVVSVQGARFGPDGGKTRAKLVAFGPHGRIKWVYNHSKGVVWSYDVDPLPNGNLFVTATRRGRTDIFELNPRTLERVWTRVLNLTDTHDADMLNRSHVAIANMRNYDETTGENDDRLLIYNRKTDEIVWEWQFDTHYPRTVGENYTDDWTHVNDIDPVGEHRFLASPRNFDQVILVDRRTGTVELRLGSDDNHDVLHRQHNPDYLESRTGRPTFLVADSENGRAVEYEYRDGEWRRTWTLGGEGILSWPRDADRLPNGNTLVTDSSGHRVLEVRPNGTVVWEVYAPWLVYDAERVRPGDGSHGPTIADQEASGRYSISGNTNRSTAEISTCDRALGTFEPGSWEPVETPKSTRQGTGTGTGTGTAWGTPPSTDHDEASDGPAGLFGIGTVAGVLALVFCTALLRHRTAGSE